MNDTSHLNSITELALGFAGFASITLVLIGESARGLDGLRVRILLQASIGALFLALVAVCLQVGGVGEDDLSRCGSALTVVFMVLTGLWNVYALRSGTGTRRRDARKAAAWVVPLWLLSLGLQIANMASLLPGRPFAWFLAGLVVLLLFSAGALLQVVFSRFS